MRKVASGIVVLISAGCQTVPASPATKSADAGTLIALPTNRPETPDEALNGNPSAVRLENIEGTLLLYFSLHKKLPASLEELKPLADIGTELKLDSPPSGRPYQYIPAGLVALGMTKRIIVADPVPNGHGQRYCILTPRLQQGQALSMEVLHLSEKEFKSYVPVVEDGTGLPTGQ